MQSPGRHICTHYTTETLIKEKTTSQTKWIEPKHSKSNKNEFECMLDHLAHKLQYKSKRTIRYINKMNTTIDQLNNISSTRLTDISSHELYITIRNIIRDILLEWNSSYKLNEEETNFLHNSIQFFNHLINTINDLTKLTSWLLDSSFIDSIAKCMNNIDEILSFDTTKENFKQLSRLFDMFSTYYERLSSKLQIENKLNRLFEGIMDCLMSLNYDRAFRKLKPNASSMTTEQKFFLIKCPFFLTTYHDPQSSNITERLLDTMIPRYASILDRHIQSINEWKSPIIHAIHHLLLTVIHADGYYTLYANGQPLQWLIDHIIRIISESSLTKKVDENSTTPETLLIDTCLRTFIAFVHEPDLLVHIKQLKIASKFHALILLSYESIIIQSYVMLSYILEEDDIKASEKESGRLLSNIFDLLRKKIKILSKENQNEKINEYHISIIVEAIQVLVQHDQIKSEIIKQNALSLLLYSCQYLSHRLKRLLLESLGSITFDKEAARILRDNTKFINSIEDMQNIDDDGIKKAAEKIIWNLFTESEKVAEREKKITKEDTPTKEKKEDDKSKKEEFQYNFMISYCHADKELVYRIHKFLSGHGFKIWFDRDNMYGPAMQAMADAVENSEFIMICMSDSYKRSVYCQAEAEYAFRCKKRLVPVIVRQGYRADGWLGLLLGSRIYVDFGRLDFKKGCELILKEVTLQKENLIDSDTMTEQLINEIQSNPIKQAIFEDTELIKTTVIETIEKSSLPWKYIKRNTVKSTYRKISIEKWTKKDVLDFLYDSNLHYMMPLCEFMTGLALIKLFQMCQTKPNSFYTQLNNELISRFNGLHLPIGIFTQFLTNMDQLINSSSSSSSSSQTVEQKKHQSESVSLAQSSVLPPPAVIVKRDKNTFTSTSLLEPSTQSSSVQQSSVLPLQQIVPPSLATTKTAYNVHVTEQTAYPADSIIQPPPNSLPIYSQQTELYKPELTFINEQTRQNSQINSIPYRRTSYIHDAQSIQKLIYP